MLQQSLLTSCVAAMLIAAPSLWAQSPSSCGSCCGTAAKATTVTAAPKLPSPFAVTAYSSLLPATTTVAGAPQEAPATATTQKTVTVVGGCGAGSCATPPTGAAPPAPVQVVTEYGYQSDPVRAAPTLVSPSVPPTAAIKTYTISGDAPPVTVELAPTCPAGGHPQEVRKAEECEEVDECEVEIEVVELEEGNGLDLPAGVEMMIFDSGLGESGVTLGENVILSTEGALDELTIIMGGDDQQEEKQCDGCCCCLGAKKTARLRTFRSTTQGHPGMARAARIVQGGQAPAMTMFGAKEGSKVELWVDGKKVWTSGGKASGGTAGFAPADKVTSGGSAPARALRVTPPRIAKPPKPAQPAKPSPPKGLMLRQAPSGHPNIFHHVAPGKPTTPKPAPQAKPKAKAPSKAAPAPREELKQLQNELKKLEKELEQLQRRVRQSETRKRML